MWGNRLVDNRRPERGPEDDRRGGRGAKAPPDGQTALITPAAMPANPALYKQLPYNTRATSPRCPCSLLGPLVLVVHPSLP
jgi:hypothetical protein